MRFHASRKWPITVIGESHLLIRDILHFIVKVCNFAVVQLIYLKYIVLAKGNPLSKPPVWFRYRLNCVVYVLRKSMIVVVEARLKHKKDKALVRRLTKY